jgi:hypothetical protein
VLPRLLPLLPHCCARYPASPRCRGGGRGAAHDPVPNAKHVWHDGPVDTGKPRLSRLLLLFAVGSSVGCRIPCRLTLSPMMLYIASLVSCQPRACCPRIARLPACLPACCLPLAACLPASSPHIASQHFTACPPICLPTCLQGFVQCTTRLTEATGLVMQTVSAQHAAYCELLIGARLVLQCGYKQPCLQAAVAVCCMRCVAQSRLCALHLQLPHSKLSSLCLLKCDQCSLA